MQLTCQRQGEGTSDSELLIATKMEACMGLCVYVYGFVWDSVSVYMQCCVHGTGTVILNWYCVTVHSWYRCCVGLL